MQSPDPSAPPGAATGDGIFAAAYRSTTIGMVALISLIAFEALAVTTAMPTVARELHGLKLYALAFGGVLATSVVGMTLSGRWSDRHGPARAIWTGLTGFVAGLVIAGLAQTMPMLLAGRLVQGFGAGCLFPALYVIVGRLYPGPLQPKLFAAFSAGWVVPALVGPALSGAIVEHLGWRWVFLGVPMLAVPAAIALVGALRRLDRPAAAGDAARARLPDAVGAAIGACLMFVAGQMDGWIAALSFAVALVLLAVCARRLLPAGTLRAARGLPAVIALKGIAASAFFSAEAFLPLMFTHQHGLSPLHSGFAISGGALGWFFGSWHQGHTTTVARPTLIRRGAAIMLIGVVLAGLGILPAVPVAVAIGAWALTGLGMGMLYASVSVLTLSMSAPSEQGANSAALQLSEALLVASTLAIGGSLFAALLDRSYALAFAATFGISAAFALLGIGVAKRIVPAP